MTFNGNGGLRDRVERTAAYVTIGVFAVTAAWVMAAEFISPEWRPSEVVFLVLGHVLSEMKAITVGRGEGGTFEGERH